LLKLLWIEIKYSLKDLKRSKMKVFNETSQMEYTIDREVVLQVIEQLKYIEVDGETIQYILQRVGMQDQMTRQLIMSQPIKDVIDLYYERRELEQSYK